MGEIIMGTDGTVEITVGDDVPSRHRLVVSRASQGCGRETGTKAEEKKAFVAGATMVASGGANGPIPIMTSDLEFTARTKASSIREVKFARRWLTAKGVMVQEEQRNPVDIELESFFQNCRDGKKPEGRHRSRHGGCDRGHPLEPGDGRRPQGLLQRNREDGQGSRSARRRRARSGSLP